MALTKVGKEGITGVSNASNATFLTATAAEGVTLAGTLAVTGVHTVGNNAIATSDGGAVTLNITQSLIKIYGNVDQGTTALKSGSLNTSSVSDDGTGICTLTHTSAMSDANYPIACHVYNDRTGLVADTNGYTYSTTAKKFDIVDSKDGTRSDYDFTYTIGGELA